MMGDTNSLSSTGRTFSSSTEIERSNTLPTSMGFFPSYTSESPAGTNSSIGCSSDPPPYPVDSPSQYQDPPPYPIDELPYGPNLHPYSLSPVGPDAASNLPFPMKIHFAYPLQGHAGPSVPTIQELEQKVGLTPSERDEIIDTLLQMRRAVEEKTEIDRKEFSNAQRKLKALLFAARSKLTEADKDEFMNEAKIIKEIKTEKEMQKLKEEKEERLRKESEKRRDSQAKEEDCHCDVWSIACKTFQLGMVILAYAENKQWKTTQLFILLCFFTTVSTICLLIFYSFGRRPPLIVIKTECVYCILCILGFYTATFTQTWRSFKMPLFGIGAMVGYALDMIRIFCLFKKRISCHRNETTEVPELRKSEDHHSPRRSFDSHHHHIVSHTFDNPSNNSRPLFHKYISDDTLLDLDFLNDNCYEEEISNHLDHHHYNSHQHSSSHLSSIGDQRRSSYQHSTNNHSTASDNHTNSDFQNTQKKIRLLLNPNSV